MHGLRLVDAIRERTFEELWDLVLWLPPGSAFAAAFEAEGDQGQAFVLRAWTTESEALVSLVNEVRAQTWTLQQSHSEKKIPVPSFIESPRSGKGTAKKNTNGSDPRDNINAMARGLLALQK